MYVCIFSTATTPLQTTHYIYRVFFSGCRISIFYMHLRDASFYITYIPCLYSEKNDYIWWVRNGIDEDVKWAKNKYIFTDHLVSTYTRV